MAAELRFIILTEADFRLAIQSFRRSHPGFLPDGAVENWTESENGTLELALTVKGGVTTNHVPFKIESHHVVEILVRFCIENNIPIPRAGRKTWLLKDKGMGLRINLGEKEVSAAYAELEALV
ncbi:MAG: hypothetical protein RLN89_15420 [Parvibaculum sp.]